MQVLIGVYNILIHKLEDILEHIYAHFLFEVLVIYYKI